MILYEKKINYLSEIDLIDKINLSIKLLHANSFQIDDTGLI